MCKWAVTLRGMSSGSIHCFFRCPAKIRLGTSFLPHLQLKILDWISSFWKLEKFFFHTHLFCVTFHSTCAFQITQRSFHPTVSQGLLSEKGAWTAWSPTRNSLTLLQMFHGGCGGVRELLFSSILDCAISVYIPIIDPFLSSPFYQFMVSDLISLDYFYSCY